MLKNIWSKTKKFVPFLLMGALFSGFVFARPAASSGPEFNIFPNDVKTFRVANSNQNTDWQNAVDATDGETVSFLVYYHNGIENTVAQNTTIKVALPTGPATEFTPQVSLFADNTAKVVTDTVTINADQTVNLSYIPGTTQIFRNRSDVAENLPDGIVSASGVNIGNIQGCWDFAGYVTFQAKLTAPEQPKEGKLDLEKMVANSTRDQGTQNWAEQTVAGEGEFVAFRMFISNPGEAKLAEVNLKDTLPAGLEYAPNTTTITRAGQTSNLSDGITGAGVSINNLEPGIANGIYVIFQARVKISDNATLVNTAVATSGELQAEDQATVIVEKTHTAIPTLTKGVLNVTRGETNYLENTTSANGETVEFEINAKNIGDLAITDLTLNDYLPAGLAFVGDPTIVESTINGVTKLTWHFDRIEANETKTIKIQAKVGEFGPGDYTLTNEANLHTACCDVLKAYARVLIHNEVPHYTLNKEVLNVTKGDGIWLENNQAKVGDILEYKITFANTGNITQNVKITDNLPAVVNYINGSGTVKVNGKVITFSNSLFKTTGLSFNLKPGDQGEIHFRVKVMENLVCASSFENISYLISPSITLKSSVITQIKCENVISKPEVLPPTGAAELIPFSILFGLVNFALFERTRRKVA